MCDGAEASELSATARTYANDKQPVWQSDSVSE